MPNEGYSIDIDVSGGANTPIALSAAGGSEALEVAVDVGGEISAVQAEKWAVGKARGVDVPSTDITYHNNSKWYASEAERIFENARVINYAVCETAGNVQTKTISVINWALEVGMWVCVRFLHKNTYEGRPRLKINDTAAKYIKYHGEDIKEGDINDQDTYLAIYDGTAYQLVGMYELGRMIDTGFGYKSFVSGERNEASGDYSEAFGRFARARDAGAMAIGFGNEDRRTETIWSSGTAYTSGAMVCVPSGTTINGGMVFRDYYFKAKKAVPAGTSPINGETGDLINTGYWEEIPKLLLTVGNGDVEESHETQYTQPYELTRRNAFGLDKAGNGYFDGDVYVNSDSKSTTGDKLVAASELNALIGANSGLATLDSSGKVPASQLPSFVDDVVEYANLAAFPATGEGGKIYVAQDTGKVYRWASNSYVIISDYVHPSYTARTGKPTADATPGFGGTFTVSQVTSDSSGHVSGMTDRTITMPSAVATGSTAGLMSAADKTKLDGIAAGAAAIDDTAGDGDDDVTWSADKLVEEAFCLTTSAISSLPMNITDARITEECVLEDFIPDERIDLGWVTTAGKLVLYGNLPSGTTLPAMKLRVHRIHGLTADARTVTLRQQNSSSENGNYLVAEAKNLIPGVQYTWRLYSVANNEDTYVYGIGSVASYPTANMWFQQVPRSLTDGTVYKVIVSPTLDSSDTTASNTVEFEAADLTPAS